MRSLADSNMGLIWAAGTDKLCYYFNKGWQIYRRTRRRTKWLVEGFMPGSERCVGIYGTLTNARRSAWITACADMMATPLDSRQRHAALRQRGPIRGYIGHCLDITDRRGQAATQAVPSGGAARRAVITDRNSVIEYVNAACLKSMATAKRN
jgi:hypothetical protein